MSQHPERDVKIRFSGLLSAAKKQDIFYLSIPLLLIVIFFWKTIFLGQAISSLDLLNQLDLTFNPNLKGSFLSVPVDPTPSLQMIPAEIFAERTLAHFEIPLWDDLTGCGRPFAADLQSPNWAPLNLLFSPNNSYIYNLGIVIKLSLGVIGTFILARFLGISCYGAAFAAPLFYFCPRMLRLFELGSNTYFYPWVLLAFLWLARSVNLTRIACVAAFTAFIFYSMHPEVFFVIVASGTLSALTYAFFHKKKEFLKICLAVVAVGILSILLVSPILLPFLEYMRNGSCYKFSDTGCTIVSATEYLINIFRPSSPGAVFSGLVAALLLPLGLVHSWKQKSPFLLLLPLLFLFSTRLGYLSQILAEQPFSYLLPEYTLYPCIFVTSIIAGAGLDAARESKIIKSPLANIILAVSLLLGIVVYLLPAFGIPTLFGTSFNATPGLSKGVLINIASLLIAGSLIRFGLHKSVLVTSIISTLLIALNFASIYKVSLQEMTPRPPFSLKAPEPIRFLQNLPGRMIATGDRTFQSNLHLIYSMEDLRSTGPLNPARFPEFMKTMGAEIGYCNTFKIPSKFNKLLDLASVRYVLSPLPLSDMKETGLKLEVKNSGKIIHGLRLLNSDLFLNSQDKSITGNILLRVHSNIYGRYEAQVLIEDETGKELCSSVSIVLDANKAARTDHTFEIPVTVPLPLSSDQPGKKIYMTLRFRDFWTSKYVLPEGFGLHLQGNSVILKELHLSEPVAIQPSNKSMPPRFKLLHVFKPHMRVYENTQAVPSCYLVSNAITASSPDEALKIIQNDRFRPDTDVVIEQSETNKITAPPFANLKNTEKVGEVEFKRISATKVTAKINAQVAGWLVLTDLYYPGWKASVDSVDTAIFQANYLFRAVQVPKGEHSIAFSYEPLSFRVGAILFFLGLFFVIASVIIHRRFREPSGTRPHSNQQ